MHLVAEIEFLVKMVQCWAPDCKHYNVRETCRFFRFPKDQKTRNRWIKLTRRTVEPGPGAYLCSCHFVDGKKDNGPTLFAYNKDKQLKFSFLKRGHVKRM
ncbi:unnamed protein product [Callosobruchus maculatus]|uniref:THAP-type domain-containing protein n=2 Tax=Callosobruchus maculatus TaxID=64391 RepID=A0A653D3I4_CALMS|nr:unnamed protein product [Callosobruchus maculatus]